MTHELKTWTEYYQPIFMGHKTFEVRKNDRNFQIMNEQIEISVTHAFHLSALLEGYSHHRKQGTERATIQMIFDLTLDEIKILEQGYKEYLQKSRK